MPTHYRLATLNKNGEVWAVLFERSDWQRAIKSVLRWCWCKEFDFDSYDAAYLTAKILETTKRN